MDIKAKTFEAESEAISLSSQALAEGRISPPAGMPDIKEALFVEGKARLLSAECVIDKIITDGCVMFYTVYLSVDDTLESFSAASAFKHSFDAPGVTADMRVKASSVLAETEFTLDGSRDIYVKGIVDVDCEITGEKMIDIADFTGSGLQMKKSSMRLPFIKETKTMTAVVREDLRIPQNMPPVRNAVFTDGFAEVKNVTMEDYKIAVEGEINAHIVYISSDDNSPMNMYNIAIPFGEVLHIESLAALDDVHIEADTEELSVRSIEDSPDILNAEAVLKITAAVRGYQDLEYTEDMYSVSTMLDLATDAPALNGAVVHGSGRTTERDTILVPEPYPPVVRVVFLRATAFVSRASALRDAASVEGIVFYRVHYAAAEGMRVYKTELPFKVEIPVAGLRRGMRVYARVFAENPVAEGSGRELSARTNLVVRVTGYQTARPAMVTGAVELGMPPANEPGLTVYFADGRETLWDVAKKFSTPLEVVKKYNLDLPEDVLPQGQKVLVFNKRQ